MSGLFVAQHHLLLSAAVLQPQCFILIPNGHHYPPQDIHHQTGHPRPAQVIGKRAQSSRPSQRIRRARLATEPRIWL